MPVGIYSFEKRRGMFAKGHKQSNTGKTHFKKNGVAWNKDKKCPWALKNGYKKGHIMSVKTKQKIREWQVNHPNLIFKDTSIELKVEAELIKRNINYQKQVPLCKIAIVDFYLPEYRIVIQCDGDYWHNRSETKEKDERQNKVLAFNGFNVYRFWEHEINKSVEECINRVITLIKSK